MLKAGLIGFGGIAQAHKNGYALLEREGKVRLTCACDIRPETFSGKVEINLKLEDSAESSPIRFYEDLDEMLRKEELDFVDICVPSYLHREMAVKMLTRGYHVLSEKPMALSFADCRAMLDAEQKSGKHFMIGQCLRFFPQYEYLKACIDDGRFGKTLSAFFSRLSAPPVWGWENWFMDAAKSGGCITDLHIHDIDIVRYLFGEPEAVSCRVSHSLTRYDSVQTSLFYGGLPVTAVGDWTLEKIPFAASYRVGFEKATVLFEGGVVTVYPKDGGEPFRPEMSEQDGYTREIAYFCDVILGKTENDRNPASSAANTIRLIEVMKQSADADGKKILFS